MCQAQASVFPAGRRLVRKPPRPLQQNVGHRWRQRGCHASPAHGFRVSNSKTRIQPRSIPDVFPRRQCYSKGNAAQARSPVRPMQPDNARDAAESGNYTGQDWDGDAPRRTVKGVILSFPSHLALGGSRIVGGRRRSGHWSVQCHAQSRRVDLFGQFADYYYQIHRGRLPQDHRPQHHG